MLKTMIAATATTVLLAGAAQAATLVSASSASQYSNTGPGLTFTDTVAFGGAATGWTNGLFTLTYSGDFHTPSGEYFTLAVDGLSLGTLSDGNSANDRFDNGTDNTLHDSSHTISAALTDGELASILLDGNVSILFTDLTPPGDWIDWVNTFDWSITADAAPAPVPLPAGMPLMIGGMALLAGLKRRKG